MHTIHKYVQLSHEILVPFHPYIGKDLAAYKNHLSRVISYCHLLSPDLSEEEHQKITIAAAYHDLGIWYNRTFDYLEPSYSLAKEYLRQNNLLDYDNDIYVMIVNHHKITPLKGCSNQLAEIFRKADWIDVSWGWIRYSCLPQDIRYIKHTFLNKGFHYRLCLLLLQRLLRHPLSPLPMMRW